MVNPSVVSVCKMDVGEGLPHNMSRRDYDRGMEVLRFHEMAHPSDKAMKIFAKENVMFNFPFTSHDVDIIIFNNSLYST